MERVRNKCLELESFVRVLVVFKARNYVRVTII